MSYFPKDTTIIDNSTNPVEGNAVYDGLALKAPLDNPTFTGTIIAQSVRQDNGYTDYSTSQTIIPTAGAMYRLTGSSQTYTISLGALIVGDEFFIALASGCPANSIIFTDVWGASLTRVFGINTKYFLTFKRSASGYHAQGIV